MSNAAIEALRQRMADNQRDAQAIIAAADERGEDLTDDEAERVDRLNAEFQIMASDLGRREVLAANAATIADPGRRTAPAAVVAEPASTGAPRTAAPGATAPRATRLPTDFKKHGKFGFDNYGQFLQAVATASRNPHMADSRLLNATPDTVSTEGVGTEGGFLVAPDFRSQIAEKVMAEDSILGMTDAIPTSSNSLVLPKDEVEQWDTTKGIQAYWEGEGAPATESGLALEQNTIRLNKLFALVPVTDELLEDASALSAYISRKAPQKIDHKVNMAIFHGTGAGQPLGFMNSGAKITQPIEGGQGATDYIWFKNIENMWGRMPGPNRRNAIWWINPELETQLSSMAFDPGSATPIPVYLPANGVSGAGYATLHGRPVMSSQVPELLGDEGDIALIDPTQYLSAVKTGGVRQDISIHLYFRHDITAFRFILRVGGQPWWSKPIQPRVGNYTQSAFITLADR